MSPKRHPVRILPIRKNHKHRHYESKSVAGTPVSSDKDEQAAAVDDSPSEDQAGRAPDNGQQVRRLS